MGSPPAAAAGADSMVNSSPANNKFAGNSHNARIDPASRRDDNFAVPF